jgi:hypothetical protein
MTQRETSYSVGNDEATEVNVHYTLLATEKLPDDVPRTFL